ncbi:MAG TPA: DUF1573 domain-containing protein [Chitinophagaceae bacterium]|nr:DUF1573 domain-containing protein [Chitinophagaceae bacterium]
MKYVLILMMAAVGIAGCQTTDNKSKLTETQVKSAMDDSTNFTTVEWLDSTYRNYGKVKEGEILEVSFHFKNTGNHNLIVADVRPGCGCTDPEKPQEPIPPGKEGVIKAKFNSKGIHGEARKFITVTANTKPSKTTELAFSTEVTQ